MDVIVKEDLSEIESAVEDENDCDYEPETDDDGSTNEADTQEEDEVEQLEFEVDAVDIIEIDENYMQEIINVLETRSEVRCENALAMNREMQKRLVEVRERLQELLKSTNERYKANEEKLKLSMRRRHSGIGMRGAYLRGGTFYFKGNMFFKDLNCRNCPNNPDYEQRSKLEGEMFPMDFELCGRHVWSVADKMSVVKAIKEQVIDYLTDRKVQKSHIYYSSDKDIKVLKKKVSVHSEKLANLLTQVEDDFTIDWQQISAHDLRHRHSPSSCQAIWNVYLQPSLKRSAWTADENKRLLEAVQTHNFQNWAVIAEMVGKRSDYQCIVQYQTTVCYMLPSRWKRWDKENDRLLVEAVEKHTFNGVTNWSSVATLFPDKPKSSIQSRYAYSLNPQISHTHFTPEEDLILLAAVEEYGTKFSCFPRTLFPNRSITQLRTRYRNTLQHRHKLTSWSIEDDKQLMDFVDMHGSSAWLKCAEKLGKHNRISCRTRYTTITKFLEKHPNAKVEDIPRKKHRFVDSTITTQNWVEKIAELRDNPHENFNKRNSKPVPETKKSRAKKVKQEQKRKKVKKNTRKKRKVGEEIQIITKEPIQQETVETLPEQTTQGVEQLDEVIKIKTKRKRKTKKQIKQETVQMLAQQSTQGVAQLGLLTEPRRVRSRQKTVYVERLRAVGLKMYHFFKYAYNFRLGEDSCFQCPPSYYSLSIVANALAFELPTQTHYKCDVTSPAVRLKCKKMLQRKNGKRIVPFGYALPLSWSTALGFRALCIQSAQVQQTAADEQTVYSHLESHTAVLLFRQRLRALFYTTALLSRLHPLRIENLCAPTICEASTLQHTDEVREDCDELEESVNEAQDEQDVVQEVSSDLSTITEHSYATVHVKQESQEYGESYLSETKAVSITAEKRKLHDTTKSCIKEDCVEKRIRLHKDVQLKCTRIKAEIET